MNAKHTTLMMTLMLVVGFTLPAAGAVVGDLVDVIEEQTTERYIVAFTADPGLRAGDTYQGERVVDFIDGLNFVVIETNSFAVFEARTLFDERVRYVEWDNPLAATLNMVPNDARYGDASHYGTKVIGAEGAWDVTIGTTAIKVGVLDTGISRNHEDFVGGRVLQGWDFYNGDNDPNDQGGQCGYHGSHTAGTVGATINNGKGIAGMAQVQILPVKAFGGGLCGGSTTALVNGLKYIGDQGSHISSNSWGSSASSSAFNDAVQYAHNKGSIHVAAAGNTGSCTNCVSFPWRDMGSISIVVSASTSTDGWASFSSQGPQVDVIAPGSGILSVDGGSTSGYKTMSGTSMSAPHVSGVAALIKTVNPGWSFSQVESTIKSTADDLGMISDRQGSGRLDACQALGSTTCGSSGGGSDPTPDPTGSDMHVHSIAHGRQGNPNTGALLIDVSIRDAAEGAVATATVCVEVTKHSTGLKASGCADTGSTGDIRFQWDGVGRDTYTTCVTGLTKSGWTWDQTADHASSGNCHTAST